MNFKNLKCDDCEKLDGFRDCFREFNERIEMCNRASRCEFNKYDFGTHQRIIRHLIRNGKHERAYLYMEDLIPRFPIECDIEKMGKYHELKDDSQEKSEYSRVLPVGCLLFIKQSEIRKHLAIFEMYEQSLNTNTIGDSGRSQYNSSVLSFSKEILDNLTRLSHLAIAKRQKNKDLETKRDFQLEATTRQMGNLKPTSLETPISEEVTKALSGEEDDLPGLK